MEVGEALVASLIGKSQPFVIDPEQPQDGRVDIVRVQAHLGRLLAELDQAAGQQALSPEIISAAFADSFAQFSDISIGKLATQRHQ